MDAAFVVEDSGFHVEQVVPFAFFEGREVALLLEFFCFEEVAGVVFVGDGDGYDVEVHEVCEDIGLSSHVEHFEDAGLCFVVGVFGSSFALCDPDGFACFFYYVVDIGGKFGACCELLSSCEAAFDDEAVVEPYEGLYPWADEEVVAYGYLGHSVAYVVEHDVKECGVEDYVAVIGDEGAGYVA